MFSFGSPGGGSRRADPSRSGAAGRSGGEERRPERARDARNGESPATPLRTYREILVGELVQGLGELERSATGLLLSGLSAGLDIGFSVLLIATAATLIGYQLPAAVVELLMANLYAVGFVFVVLGRSELFTEHTTLAIFPLLEGSAPARAVARLWGLVYVSNLAGATVFAGLIVWVGPSLGTVDPGVLGELARRMVDHPAKAIVLSGLLAGWLMGLMSWLATAARDTTSQLLLVWLVAASIGLAGLHHCIVGSVEVLAGVFSDPALGFSDFLHFLSWSTLGNAVGGVVFVAVVKFGHAVRPGTEPRPEDVAPGSDREERG